MGKYIDWYLVEIERKLGNLVARERLHETLVEVEDHLAAAKEAAMEIGLDEAKAELAAIEAFGPANCLVAGCVRNNPRSVHIALHVLAGVLATGGIFLLAASLFTHTQAWPLVLFVLVTAFVFLSAKATRAMRWQALGIMVVASTLIQIVAAGIIYAPIESVSGTSFIPRSRAAAIVRGEWEPPKTLSKAMYPGAEDLHARARAAMETTSVESMAYLSPQIAGFNCFVLGGLLALHFVGFGLGFFARRLGRRPVIT